MKTTVTLLTLALTLCLAQLRAVSYPDDWIGDHEVARGDTLWGISAENLSDPFLWPLIYSANPQLIKNPDLIFPGWRLSMPLSPSEAETLAALEIARLYKESVPLIAIPLVAVNEDKVSDKALAPVMASDPLAVFWALYLVLVALAAGAVAIMHMREAPHHEVEMVNPKGVHLMPWASINEISGNAMPEMEEELREAA